MNIKHLLSLFLIILSLISIVNSVKVEVSIKESSNLLELYPHSYKLDTYGVVEIYNPSKYSKIYEFNFPISLDSLIGISYFDPENYYSYTTRTDNEIFSNITSINLTYMNNKINNKSSLKFKIGDDIYFSYDDIKGYLIKPGEKKKFGYHIFGLIDYNVFNNSVYLNKSIFEYYMEDRIFNSNLIINLQKPQREGNLYNKDGSINKSIYSEQLSKRLITSNIQNPTDFDYLINSLNFYRTNVGDPTMNSGRLIKDKKNIEVKPFGNYKFDFFDSMSNDYSVYWVSYDSTINSTINSDIHYNFILSNSSDYSKFLFNKTFVDSVIVKKSVNKTIIHNGESFKVSLNIVNLNNFTLNNLHLFDELPNNYEINDISENVKIKNISKLEFSFDNLSAYSNHLIEYSLTPKKDFKGVTYLKPAILKVLNYTFYSSGVLVINDLLPNKKVFIQKEIEIVDDNFVRVTIKVKNLGSVSLKDLLIVDDIGDNVIIKDISKVFYERGTWKIKELKAGGEWEVSYLAERGADLDTIPNVFGVDKSEVYGTLISSDEVVTIYNDSPKTIEKVGLGFAIGLLIFYLLF